MASTLPPSAGLRPSPSPAPGRPPERPGAGTEVDADNPWPGLASFSESAHALFFGRRKETDELVRLVRRNTVTVLFGQSGLGKSSLLCAGAFPVLRAADYLPIRLRLDHAPSAPSLARQVMLALLDACAAAGADCRAAGDGETLWEYFHRRDADIWSATNRLLTPVLAFDQFEEIFTLGHASEAARERGRAFLVELADLVENRIPAVLRPRFESGELDLANYYTDKPLCQVVLTLREDFLPELEGLKRSMRSIMQSRMRVCRLTGLQALEIVQKPAPHLLAEGVAERIVEFVSGARGGSPERLAEIEVEPALLSVICRELNVRRQARGDATITPDLVSGNRREILVDFYTRSIADLPATMRLFIEDRLLTTSGFRDNLALESALEIPGVTRPQIDTLVSRRLLRIEERLGVHRVELTHDVLAEVIRHSRDERLQQAALSVTRRRMWRARIIAAVLLVLLTGASWFGWNSTRARAAEAQRAGERLAEESRRAERLRQDDARRADEQRRAAAVVASQTDIALAAKLLEQGRTADALAYLVRAAQLDPANSLLAPRILGALASRSFLLPNRPPLPLPSAAGLPRVTADGSRVVFASNDGVVRVVSLGAWKVEKEFRLAAKVSLSGLATADENPDIFAADRADGVIQVYDLSTGEPRGPELRRPGRSQPFIGVRIGLSPDGRYLVGGDRSRAYVWDTESGEVVATLRFNQANKFGYSISAGNRFVLSLPTASTVALNSPRNGAELQRIPLGPNRGFIGSGFSPDGRKLVLALNAPSAVRVYDLDSSTWIGDEIRIDQIGRLAFSRDSRRYAIASEDGKVLIADLATGAPVSRLQHPSGRAFALGLNADGTALLTSGTDGFMRIWNADTGRIQAESTLQRNHVTPALLTPDGRSVLMFANDPVAVFHLEIGRTALEPLVLPRSNRTVANVGFLEGAPAARLLWMLADRAKVIEVSTGAEVGEFPYPLPLRQPNLSPGFTAPDRVRVGQRLIVRAEDGRWHSWQIDHQGITNDVVLKTRSPRDEIGAMNSEGTFLVTRTNRPSFEVLSGVTGEVLHRIEQGSGSKRISEDGRYLLHGSGDGRAVVRDLETGREARIAGAGFTLRPDMRRIYAAANQIGKVAVYDGASGRLVRGMVPHLDQVRGFSVSRDGKYFASYSIAGTVQICNGVSGAQVGPVLQHNRPVRTVQFSPDSRRLLVGLTDGWARVYDVVTGAPVTEVFNGGSDIGGGGGFSPNGNFVMLKGQTGGSVRIWPVPQVSSQPVPSWLLKLATACAGRRLTEQGGMVNADDAFVSFEELRREIGALPRNSPYLVWGRWLVSDSARQTIGPGFRITPAAARKLRADYAAIAGVPVEEPAAPDDEPLWSTDP
jgi:WD40 repeat protein